MDFKPLACVALLFVSACGTGEVDVYGTMDTGSTRFDGGTMPAFDTGRRGPDGATPVGDDAGTPGEDMGAPGDDMGTPPPRGQTRYDPGELRSAMTPNVATNLRAIRASSASPNDAVFMKVGASGTVNSNFLDCFASVDVNGGNAALQPTVTYFRQTDLDGATSWDRDTLAAVVGRTASWAQSGSPSPIAQEVAAINPRFALVNYGTNDMQQGVTHESALWPFWDNMWTLVTGLMADGIVPIVTGLNPRSDSIEAAYWVPSYNEATRAMAQALQLPYLDLYNAVVDLDDMGLVGDGIHGNAAPGGACAFDAAGLAYNYNVRNLLTLQLIDVTRRVVVDGEDAPDLPRTQWTGAGTASDPIVIDRLPFSHDASTVGAPSDAFDAYPSCGSGQNESGPEFVYRLELDAPTRVRAMVFDQTADIDIHHLEGTADASACRSRDDRIVQGPLAAGTHYFVADTYVGGAGEQAGDFTFVVVECEAGDAACN